MRLSLIFPSWCGGFGIFKNLAKTGGVYPPLNLCLLAAIAEKAGWDVQIIEAEINNLDTSQIIEQLTVFKPHLVGLTATTPFFQINAELAASVKAALPIPIVIGGDHASIVRQKAFMDQFDYLCIGECDLTWADFLKQFEIDPNNITAPGYMYRKDGNLIYTGDAPVLQNLDELPYPARYLLPYEKYKKGTLEGTKRFTSLMTTRGCPFHCVFCANDLHGKKTRRRSIENVMEEIEMLIHEYAIEHISILDDCLTLDRNYILGICDEIKRRDLHFTFDSATRANLWDEELATRLREAGLIRISFGLESVDPKVRKLIKKEVPLESYIAANRLNNRLGIETFNSAMLGLPGDTRESIKSTVDFLCKSREIQQAIYYIAVPYPGTELYDMARKGEHGLRLIDDNFSHYHRYGVPSTMEVNGIGPIELSALHKKGLLRIYSRWWRWRPIIQRFGPWALTTAFLSNLSSQMKKFFSRTGISLEKPLAGSH